MMIHEILWMDVLDFIQYIKKTYKREDVKLVIADPPYNIYKDDWDVIPNYIGWCGKWIKGMEEMLALNGSFFIFHNQFRAVRDIDLWIEKYTDLDFRNFIIWNKRFKGGKNYEYLNTHLKVKGLRKFQKMAEYILYYAFSPFDEIRKKREEKGITQKRIASEVRSRTNGITGWVSNVEKGYSVPTEEQIKAIEKHLPINVTKLITQFYNQGTHHSVWNYGIAKRVRTEDHRKKKLHLTPKPIPLIKNILRHATKEGDMVVNLFSGTGNVEIACKEEGRSVVGCENDKEYWKLAMKRLSTTQKRMDDFL